MTARRTTTIEADAQDRKRGMTLAELAAFIDEAHAAEIDDTAIVRIDVTWQSSIKKIKVTG